MLQIVSSGCHLIDCRLTYALTFRSSPSSVSAIITYNSHVLVTTVNPYVLLITSSGARNVPGSA